MELSSAQSALDEKAQRVIELEDTLKGTSLLVRQKVEAVYTNSLVYASCIIHIHPYTVYGH